MATLEDGSMSSEGGILPSQCTMLSSEGVMTFSESGRHVLYFRWQHGEFGGRRHVFKGGHHVLKCGKCI